MYTVSALASWLQLFYKTHILGFLGFMLFGFMHHISLWAYTMPGTPLLPISLCASVL